MNSKSWPAYVKGIWWNWIPLPGLDPALGESVMWLGAAKWATLVSEGVPETIAHQEAEKLIYESVYKVIYKK
jgi:hypothetical protein